MELNENLGNSKTIVIDTTDAEYEVTCTFHVSKKLKFVDNHFTRESSVEKQMEKQQEQQHEPLDLSSTSSVNYVFNKDTEIFEEATNDVPPPLKRVKESSQNLTRPLDLTCTSRLGDKAPKVLVNVREEKEIRDVSSPDHDTAPGVSNTQVYVKQEPDSDSSSQTVLHNDSPSQVTQTSPHKDSPSELTQTSPHKDSPSELTQTSPHKDSPSEVIGQDDKTSPSTGSHSFDPLVDEAICQITDYRSLFKDSVHFDDVVIFQKLVRTLGFRRLTTKFIWSYTGVHTNARTSYQWLLKYMKYLHGINYSYGKGLFRDEARKIFNNKAQITLRALDVSYSLVYDYKEFPKVNVYLEVSGVNMKDKLFPDEMLSVSSNVIAATFLAMEKKSYEDLAIGFKVQLFINHTKQPHHASAFSDKYIRFVDHLDDAHWPDADTFFQ